MGLGREARDVTNRAYDPRGQDGTYAEDPRKGGAGSFHLGLDAPAQVRDLSIQRSHVTQYLRGQPPAEAGRGTLGTYAAQDARGPLGRELSGHPAGEEVPQEPVEAVERPGALGHQIFSSLGKQAQCLRGGLVIYLRQPVVARGRAKAVARASSSSFLRALPVESTRTRAESFGGTSTTDSPEAANLTAR